MKNKETVIGWILIIVLMLAFSFYQKKKFAEEQALKKDQVKTQQLEKTKEKAPETVASVNDTAHHASIATASETVVSKDSSNLASKYGAFSSATKGEEKLFVLENDFQKITLTNKGGQIKSVELKKYKTWDKKPLILFTDKTNSLSYQLPIENNQNVDTKELYFEATGEPFVVTGDSSKTFSLRVNAGEGKYFEQRYTLKGNSYLLTYDVNLVGLNTVIPANNTFISVSWNNYLNPLEHNIQLERRYSALYFKYNKSDVNHLNEDKESDSLLFNAPLEWISYKQQFFNTTLFSSKGDFHVGKLKTHFSKDDVGYVKQYDAGFTIPYNNSGNVSYSFQYYIGPNSYNTLASINKDVESIIKLSPDFWLFSWIRYITRFIIWVFSWFDRVHLNYGIIILLMTLILKVVLHPLTAKSIESSAKMKILAPELAALKEKYGDDQTKIGQEQMKLYSRAGVSPFGGCLPLLIQMPILMAMYYFFPASIELRQQPFLWATDLSSYDSIVTFATALPILNIDHISLFTILMTLSSIGQAVMNNQLNAMNNQQPGMKYMPYFMPLLLMFMFNSFPAALTYYYLLQNLLGVGHQWVIQKFFINDTKLRKQIEDNKKNPKPASSWQKKLSDIQKQAEQRGKSKN